MKSLLSMMFVCSMIAFANLAHANDFSKLSRQTDEQNASFEQLHDSLSAPLYTCKLAGSIRGHSIAIGIGGQYLHGNGVLSCVNNIVGDVVSLPVHMEMFGAGIGIDFTFIKGMRVYSAGIGANDPHDFVRSYNIGATAGGTLIAAGLDFDAAIRAAGSGGFGFEVGMTGKNAVGLGAHLYGMGFKISRR